jgi:hypothetical protein
MPSPTKPLRSVPTPKKKIALRRSSVFPILIPEMPASIFPITSQEDLVSKISRLFPQPFPKKGKRGASLPIGIDPTKISSQQAKDE